MKKAHHPNLRPPVRAGRKAFQRNLIRDKMRDALGWTTQRGIPLFPGKQWWM